MTARLPDELRAKITADYNSGLIARLVAEKYGIGTASVYRVARGTSQRGTRKFPASVMDEAVRDYLDSGDAIRTVAARHPMSEDTLRLELKERDVTRATGSTIPTKVKDAAIDDFLAGMSISRVSEKHQISRSTITAWMDAMGVGAEDREGESPHVYKGGWIVGPCGVRRPAKPVRQRSAA